MRVVIFAAVCAIALASPLVPEQGDTIIHFRAWMAEHGKAYGSQEAFDKAHETYVANEAVIAALNADEDDHAEYGHTQFSDLTPEEFINRHLPRMPMNAAEGLLRGGNTPTTPPRVLSSRPDAFDWRDQGAVSPVKDQGPCGSCWAESAVQNVESVTFLKANGSKPLVPLSTQQVVECDSHDYACYGGYPSGAFQYIQEIGGLAAMDAYPYNVDGKTICLANQTFNETCGLGMCDDPPLTGYCDVTCSDKTHDIVATISGWQALPSDEDQLAAALAASNPISVALDASGVWGALHPWLQFYKKGVANPKKCSDTALDHAVLLVGYGTDGSDYWTVKNSWGPKWGEDGYFRIVRGQGKCGINTLATTALA